MKRHWVETGDSHETSREIMAAIWEVAGYDDERAERMWQDPTPEEVQTIIGTLIDNGRCYDPGDFCWGAAGHDWARYA